MVPLPRLDATRLWQSIHFASDVLLVDASASIATIRQRLRSPVLRMFLNNLFSSFSSVVSQILPGMAGEVDVESQALFSQCRFIIVRNEALTQDVATEVCF